MTAPTGAAVQDDLLPAAADVRGLLRGLLDRDVAVHEQPRPVLPGRGVHLVGTCVDADGALQALLLCDLALACVLGGALAVVPPPRVQEALDGAAVPQDLADDAEEVLHVAASLFATPDGHLRLREVQVAPAPASGDVVALLRAAPVRRDLRVEVPGYGAGVLVLLRRQA